MWSIVINALSIPMYAVTFNMVSQMSTQLLFVLMIYMLGTVMSLGQDVPILVLGMLGAQHMKGMEHYDAVFHKLGVMMVCLFALAYGVWNGMRFYYQYRNSHAWRFTRADTEYVFQIFQVGEHMVAVIATLGYEFMFTRKYARGDYDPVAVKRVIQKIKRTELKNIGIPTTTTNLKHRRS